MTRETKIIETPAGRKVEIKTYFTQSERVKVQKLLAGDSVAREGIDAEPKVSDLLEAQRVAVELAVVSIDGVTENASKILMDDLPASEYDAVSVPVLELVNPDLQVAK